MTTSRNRDFLPTREAIFAFDAVMRLGSYTHAAKELDITQATVSWHIKTLEEGLDVLLFKRHGRNLRPTDAATAYHEKSMAAMRLLREAIMSLDTKNEKKNIRVAVLPTVSSRWLVPNLARFLEANDDITISLSVETKPFNFRTTGYDVAVHAGYGDWPDAHSELLFPEEVMVVCSPQILKKYQVASETDLANIPLLVTEVVGLGFLDQFQGRSIPTPKNKVIEFEAFGSVVRAAVQGMGIAILPVFLIQRELRTGELVCAWGGMFKTGRGYYLVHPRDRLDFDYVTRFRNWSLAESATLVVSIKNQLSKHQKLQPFLTRE
ncbi:LysR substrate-binding domain-containing protein [uncultured Ruegeria sp.]|uniref:LysR substrate-binding domain-containing protein n=1 Tax=uncultured Ruegeria sp. TaxID=259304 RepID=UPI00261FA4A2|nr:LysR substrate-binding domain-containing protein [uncultured Ruegeria sp.]